LALGGITVGGGQLAEDMFYAQSSTSVIIIHLYSKRRSCNSLGGS